MPPLAQRNILKLWGLLTNWASMSKQPWVREYLGAEESERDRRSLERRIHGARLGAFKSLADFDWSWPQKIDRDQIEDLMQLSFLEDATNVVLLGPSGIGKTMVAQNLGHQALQHGHTVRRVRIGKRSCGPGPPEPVCTNLPPDFHPVQPVPVVQFAPATAASALTKQPATPPRPTTGRRTS